MLMMSMNGVCVCLGGNRYGETGKNRAANWAANGLYGLYGGLRVCCCLAAARVAAVTEDHASALFSRHRGHFRGKTWM